MKKSLIAAGATVLLVLALTGCATPEDDATDNTFDQIGTLVVDIAEGITGQ